MLVDSNLLFGGTLILLPLQDVSRPKQLAAPNSITIPDGSRRHEPSLTTLWQPKISQNFGSTRWQYIVSKLKLWSSQWMSLMQIYFNTQCFTTRYKSFCACGYYILGWSMRRINNSVTNCGECWHVSLMVRGDSRINICIPEKQGVPK
jgi:hypothetical protein